MSRNRAVAGNGSRCRLRAHVAHPGGRLIGSYEHRAPRQPFRLRSLLRRRLGNVRWDQSSEGPNVIPKGSRGVGARPLRGRREDRIRRLRRRRSWLERNPKGFGRRGRSATPRPSRRALLRRVRAPWALGHSAAVATNRLVATLGRRRNSAGFEPRGRSATPRPCGERPTRRRPTQRPKSDTRSAARSGRPYAGSAGFGTWPPRP